MKQYARRLSRAKEAIQAFLREVGQDPDIFDLCEDGDGSAAQGKCGWAWWQKEEETTSYVHADLSVEYYGTYPYPTEEAE